MSGPSFTVGGAGRNDISVVLSRFESGVLLIFTIRRLRQARLVEETRADPYPERDIHP